MLETVVGLLKSCHVLRFCRVKTWKAFQLWEYNNFICRYFEIYQTILAFHLTLRCVSFSTGVSRYVVMCDHARLGRNSHPIRLAFVVRQVLF